MMKLPILKGHGSNNDFILIDETNQTNQTNHPIGEDHRARLTRTLCNRGTGVGADGVLFYQASESADCKMRMLNPDGGEAEMCGNGLRLIGRYASEKLMKPKVSVETAKAILAVQRGSELFDGIETFEAEIGPISLAPACLPMQVDGKTFIDRCIPELSDSLKFTALSVPNPHIVAIVDRIDENRVTECGAAANHSAVFPKGVNMSFVESLGQNRLFVVTYERGVGITRSCGTAMSASAYVSALLKHTDRSKPISVYNRGGLVQCDVSRPETRIILKGNATFVFEATIEVSDDYQSIDPDFNRQLRPDEIRAYESLEAHAKT
ncbi:MAG: diaminopimelate epimerase, partial [Methylococcales bacterium]